MSAARDYELGERVWATVGSTGYPRRGVVAGRLDPGEASFWATMPGRYFVRFDGDIGWSGPCVVLSAEEGKT